MFQTGYLNWKRESGEPDNDSPAGSNCVAMYKNISNPSSFGWMDVGCDDNLGFICQYYAGIKVKLINFICMYQP